MDINAFVNSVVLTTAVLAALVASITDIVISLFTNHRLKKMESQKHVREIDTYRYSRLYELILNWHKYDSEYKGESAGEIAFNRMFNLFLDDKGRYEIARPLLDKTYVEQLDIMVAEGEHLLESFVIELTDVTHLEDYDAVKDYYFDAGKKFSKALKKSINSQLEILLSKSS